MNGVAGAYGELFLAVAGDHGVEAERECAAATCVPRGLLYAVRRVLGQLDAEVVADSGGAHLNGADLAVVACHYVGKALVACRGVDVRSGCCVTFFKNHHVGKEPAVLHGAFFLFGIETEFAACGHIGEGEFERLLAAVGHVCRGVRVNALHRGRVAFHLHAHIELVILVGPCLCAEAHDHGLCRSGGEFEGGCHGIAGRFCLGAELEGAFAVVGIVGCPPGVVGILGLEEVGLGEVSALDYFARALDETFLKHRHKFGRNDSLRAGSRQHEGKEKFSHTMKCDFYWSRAKVRKIPYISLARDSRLDFFGS